MIFSIILFSFYFFVSNFNNSQLILVLFHAQSLRLYDVDCSRLRLQAPSEAALIDCCFQEESVAFSAGSDGSVTRFFLYFFNCSFLLLS